MDATPPPPPTGSAIPPGWYWDGAAYRWWDGRVWTPYLAPPPVDSDDRTLATLSHAGLLAGGFILPLVLYLISRSERRPETRHHAREALNFQLTFLLVYVGAFALGLGGLIIGLLTSSSDEDELDGIGLLGVLGFGGMFFVIAALFVVNAVFSLIGAVRAHRGERWRYPIRIPFVRG